MRDHRHTWTYLFGAVCLERPFGAPVVLPYVDVEAIYIHLAQSSHAVFLLDRAGWRISPKLRVPENVSLLSLSSYAPESNPVENVWAHLHANLLSLRIWDSYNAIVDACWSGWNRLMDTPERLASITRRTWAKTVSG